MSDGKNRERDGALALSGRHLVKRRNNQLIVHQRGDKTGAERAGGHRVIALAVELISEN
jgi:hypothetical protein